MRVSTMDKKNTFLLPKNPLQHQFSQIQLLDDQRILVKPSME
jgi:hypothetical protein